MADKNKLKIGHINTRSLRSHIDRVRNVIVTENLDVLCVSETWLSPDVMIHDVSIDGFKFIRRDYRARGSGVGIYIKENIKYKVIPSSGAIEQLCIQFTINSVTLVISVVYRNHGINYKEFISELESTVSSSLLLSENICILGDININLFNSNDSATVAYCDFLKQVGLLQLISEATRHASQSLIDHILISNDELVLLSGVTDVDIADHDLIYCVLRVKKPVMHPKFITRRNLKTLEKDIIISSLRMFNLDAIYYIGDINIKIEYLTSVLMTIFDALAPNKTFKITKEYKPWITSNIKYMITLRNKAKAEYKRSLKQADWEFYKDLRNMVTTAVRNEKKAYLNFKLRNPNKTVIYKELKLLDMINQKRVCDIPDNLSDVNDMNHYFVQSHVNSSTVDHINCNDYSLPDGQFSFILIDDSLILKYLQEIQSDCAGSDQISVSMIKLCSPQIIPYITNIINSCLLENYFPDSWKQAMVKPLVKKDPPVNLGDLRSICILPVLSKIFEKVIYYQMTIFLEENNILPETQSGFRPGFSCTTALAAINDDIIKATDEGMYTFLVLLDYTRAFDTVNHKLLLEILKAINFSDNAVMLLRSYLTGRTQRVELHARLSNSLSVNQGVPQGSVLGPPLFTIYTSCFHKYVRHCKIHTYADDTQLYYSFRWDDFGDASCKVNEDLSRIHMLSESYNLCLNPSKSRVILFGGVRLSYMNETISLRVAGAQIPVVKEVINLGLVMDNTFRYKGHIARCLQRAYNNLRILYPHRSWLSEQVKTSLCETLVMSHFWYCSQVYSSCLDSDTTSKIQKVQNSCLRYIFGIRKFEHISHKLRDVKWLNIRNRFEFLRACFYYKVVINKSPPYLCNKIRFRTDVHGINIRRKDVLEIPQYKLSLFRRCFTYDICSVFNGLPRHLKMVPIKQFKKAFFNLLFEKNC